MADATLIVPGVLNGSQGALYYPPKEINKNPVAWNMMPILDQHPDRSYGYISARDPKVLEKQGLGFVFKSYTKNNSLKSELWFDEERVKKLNFKIYDALTKGSKIELSTGLYTKNKPAQNGAMYNGRSYSYVATNYKPDHLAILVDQKGACSLEDGCGVFNTTIPSLDRRVVEMMTVNVFCPTGKGGGIKTDCGSGKGVDDSKPGSSEHSKKLYSRINSKLKIAEALMKTAPSRASMVKQMNLVARLRKQLTKIGMHISTKNAVCNCQGEKMCNECQAKAKKGMKKKRKKMKVAAYNDASHNDIHSQLSNLIRERFKPTVNPFTDQVMGGSAWVVEIYDGYFIYQYGGQLFKLGYKVEDGEASVSKGEPVKVKRVTTYKQVSNQWEVGFKVAN